MKQFIIKILIFVAVAFILLEIISTAVLSSDNYFYKRIPWSWIHVYERDADQLIRSDTLILGESIGRQLFPHYQKKNHYATNATGFTMTAYLLTNRLFYSNPNLNEITIIANPSGLTYEFENAQIYKSFILPFYTYKNLKYFDRQAYKKISQKPLALLSFINTLKVLPIGNFNYASGYFIEPTDQSSFNWHNLVRLNQFAKENNIHITMVASPMKESSRLTADKLKDLKQNIKKNGLSNMFTGYFENMVYLPDSCFIDKYHFTPSYLKKNRKDIIGLMKQLKD